ncbi:MAG: cupin domain-containing protein [Rhodospirillaceae bacterium]
MATQVDVKAPWWTVIGPDEGESIWQPEPTQGYVTINLSPDNMPYDSFTSGIQVLPPGCNVREHGHRQNHELLFVYEGTGRAEIEDETYDIVPGSTIMFGRYARHFVENTGDVDMKFFWVFFPPALEDWFRAIGKPRTPGEPMPEKFPRPENVMDIYNGMKFIPPRPDAK